jgi:predicted PurR-regulated permease PerM
MKLSTVKLPLYVKFAVILSSICLLVVILYFGQHILIPVLLSLIFAILLRPAVGFLNKKLRFPNVIAALVAVTLTVLVIAAIVFFVSWQISGIANDWVKIQHNLTIQFGKIQVWLESELHMSYGAQQVYIDKVTGENVAGNSELMGNTLNSFTDTLVNAMLIPIYTFLMLLYRNLFVRFLRKIVSNDNEYILADVLGEVKVVIQSYVVGLLIETGIVALLTTGGLMLLGVPYAVLLGVITGILNLIPYIGILIAALITILATLINSTDFSLILGVVGLSILVQFIDNNLLVPRIVGNKVRINALVSMLGVVIGGFIAGIAGMFLAIPIIAILKVVCDRIQPLAPLGYLMGDDISKIYTWGKINLPDFSEGSNNEPWPVQERKPIPDNKPEVDKKA